jgi:phage-related holin
MTTKIVLPVSVVEDEEVNGFIIYDAQGIVVVIVEQHVIDYPAKLVAESIVESLNSTTSEKEK